MALLGVWVEEEELVAATAANRRVAVAVEVTLEHKMHFLCGCI